MIPRISAILRLGRVPVPHTNEAVYALDATGRRWVAKREADMGCEALLAEAITWLLARRLGVPVPEAAFCDADGERAWLSAWVPHAKHWSAASAGQLRNADAAAAILTLDAVVCNEARHGGNLLLVADPAGGSTAFAIDADEALIGHPAELEQRGLVPPDPRILAHGFPPPGLRDPALHHADRCAALDPVALAADAAEACAVAREPHVERLTRVLLARCAAARALTTRYL
ncbi:MAG: hypothetical protein LDL15_04410, partial [Yonghaparkia sp.]|nr:hypothetical protein [Microcella sp.]